MNFIQVKNGIAKRVPVPEFLPYDAEALADLSWLDPTFGLTDCVWWPEQVVPVELDPLTQTFDGTETLTLDIANKVVLSLAGVRSLNNEENDALYAEVAARAQQLAAQIDTLVAERLSHNSVFLYGYEQRESVALAYRAAGYVGEEDEWVSSFSDATGMPYRDAVDLVIAQGAGMRAAVRALESLRMGKFRILRQTTMAQVQEVYGNLVGMIAAVVIP